MNASLRIFTFSLLSGVLACGQSPAQLGPVNIVDNVADTPAAANPASDVAAARGFERLTGPTMNGRPPHAVVEDGMVTVLVVLDGSSVAEARGAALAVDSQLSDSETATIADSLQFQQNRLAPAIEAMGGRVVGKFQYAVNGMKVMMDVQRLPSLLALPGVIGIKHVPTYQLNNATSVPYIGAPAVWAGDSSHGAFHGEGIKVGIIDTGIDYTHANFNGPGTADAYNTAHDAGAEKLAANPAWFGPAAPRVKGGYDFVGDDYDPGARNADGTPNTAKRTPQPDPNPLDCNGHGSHVAGTTGGSGVKDDGTTYTGPYNSSTHSSNTFRIGPGVAPKVDLYAYRVFGCTGATNVVLEAIDKAVQDRMQVINMSLGSPFGTEESSDALASSNAEKAGTLVVCSAGNSGPATYIVGSPSTGERVISTAALDTKSSATVPSATLVMSSGTITVENSNGASFTSITGDAFVMPVNPAEPASPNAGLGIGCLDSDYATVSGTVVMTSRGSCARIYRAQAGWKHGARAVVMVTDAGNAGGIGAYPPFEGPIPSCIQNAPTDNSVGRPCDAGETPVTIDIPFFGAKNADLAKVKGATGPVTATPGSGIPNPSYHSIASFSSGGPRAGYNADGFHSSSAHLKPNLAAPGVNITSTGSGTGNGSLTISGTSMASPHVAGVVALALQAHPTWHPDDVRIAVLNTASNDSSLILNWSPRLAGAGVVQPLPATRTAIVARGDTGSECPPGDSVHCGESDLSLGAVELKSDFHTVRTILVRNLGTERTTFNVTTAAGPGARTHTISVIPATFALAGGFSIRLKVTIDVPATTAGQGSTFTQVSGLINITPTAGNGGAAAHLPYYMGTRARSDVAASVQQPFNKNHPNSTVFLQNNNNITGTADFYAYGLTSGNSSIPFGIRAAGVQTFPDAPPKTDAFMVFAINTYKPLPNAAMYEFDVNIYLNGHTDPDYSLVSFDQGYLTTGSPSGRAVVFVFNNTAGTFTLQFATSAQFDGSTLLLPVYAGTIGLANTTTGTKRFQYDVDSYFTFQDDNGTTVVHSDHTVQKAWFNAFSPSIDTGQFESMPAFAQKSVPISIHPDEWAFTPTKGVMVVDTDNSNFGAHNQALLFKVPQN